jgi:hypothetical protein
MMVVPTAMTFSDARSHSEPSTEEYIFFDGERVARPTPKARGLQTLGEASQEGKKTMKNIDLSKVTPATEMRGDSDQDTALLKQMLKEAEAYLCSFDWCESIAESYFGLGIGGVVAVSLFRIVPKQKAVDEWLWVVGGDLPPAYLVTDDNPTPASALEAYVAEMSAWADAVEKGQSVDDLIPVNVPPTRENAQQLRKRLTFLSEKVIPLYAA